MPFWPSTIGSDPTIYPPSVNPCSVGINGDTPIAPSAVFPEGITVGTGIYQSEIAPDDEDVFVITEGVLGITALTNPPARMELTGSFMRFVDLEGGAGNVGVIEFNTGAVTLTNISAINNSKVAVSGNAGALTIQQGEGTLDGAGNLLVNLATAFRDTTYSVTISANGTAPTNIPFVTKTTSSFFTITGDALLPCCWIAVGLTA